MPRLLLIDADARLSAMMADYLRNAGFGVDLAATLSEGRRWLLMDNYDALVLDFMLPDGDGLDLTRELRADSKMRRLPLLMLTTRGEPLERVVSLDLGAGDYLVKPFEPRKLLARLKALLFRVQPDTPPMKRCASAGLKSTRARATCGSMAAKLSSPRTSSTCRACWPSMPGVS